jgi:arabinose-5-phosphate isomerase
MATEPPSKSEIPVSSTATVRERMVEILRLEASMISAASERLGDDCDEIVDLLVSCSGRILLTGLGKTGFVARKAAATLCSTGAPAIFLHPSEAVHGDLGIVSKHDVLVAMSNSGETEEILKLIEFMSRSGVPVIALTGNLNSTLACHSNFVIDCQVAREADQLSLAPTCSTTLMLAVSDALAIAVMEQRGFTAEEFAQYHPGGALGKKLLLKVGDVMHVATAIPVTDQSASLRDAIELVSQHKLGCLFLTDGSGKLSGVLTDGDLRRCFQAWKGSIEELMDSDAATVMTQDPLAITSSHLAAVGLRLMEDRQITVLPVIDNGNLVGVVHLHDLIKAGLA